MSDSTTPAWLIDCRAEAHAALKLFHDDQIPAVTAGKACYGLRHRIFVQITAPTVDAVAAGELVDWSNAQWCRVHDTDPQELDLLTALFEVSEAAVQLLVVCKQREVAELVAAGTP